jgi:preprotein translocase subunit SecA
VDEQWDVDGLHKQLYTDFGVDLPIRHWLATEKNLHEEPLLERIQQQVAAVLQQKEDMIGSDNMRRLERDIMLHVLDGEWKEHLAAMDYLRQSVGLRGYAQKNPKQEYKREAFEMFEQLLERIKHDVVAFLMRIQLQEPQQAMAELEEHPAQPLEFSHPDAGNVLADDEEVVDAVVGHDTYQREGAKIGRNDPCPCGSGKKYKNCHGKLG